jgi:hypothetical protein
MILLYSFLASSLKPKNKKKIYALAGIAHHNKNMLLMNEGESSMNAKRSMRSQSEWTFCQLIQGCKPASTLL